MSDKAKRAQLVVRIPHLLDTLRRVDVKQGYAGGNLLNLPVQLGEELIGYTNVVLSSNGGPFGEL